MLTNPEEEELKFRAALDSGDIPHIYFNGFTNAMGQSDITSVLFRSGAPAATLNMSYTTAKTFALKLGQLVASLEAETSHEIMTTDDINNYLSKDTEE